jgi:hypothetical protein
VLLGAVDLTEQLLATKMRELDMITSAVNFPKSLGLGATKGVWEAFGMQLQGQGLLERVVFWKQTLPREGRLLTGQIVLALADAPEGLSKRDLMERVTGERLASRSLVYVEALDTAFSKRIQRSRKRIQIFGLDIVFDRKGQRWLLVASERASGGASWLAAYASKKELPLTTSFPQLVSCSINARTC